MCEISKTFADDPLRMLRGIRFASILEGFTIETNTLEAIKEHAHLITSITKERIREELDKIYHKGSPFIAFQLMMQTGLSYLLFNYHKYSIRDRFTKDRFTRGGGTYEDFYFRIFYDPNSNEDIGDTYMKTLCGEKIISDRLRSMKVLYETETTHLPQLMYTIFEHNKHFTEFAKSRVLKENNGISTAFFNFVMYPTYPKSLKELKINGNDILPLVDNDGKKVGYILKKLIAKIYNNEVRNDEEYLLERAKLMIKEEL